jgi:hypothetical protein
MADDESPDILLIGISGDRARALKRLPNGAYVDMTAPAYGSGIVTDSTGKHTFDLGSLACKFAYDANGNQTVVTYGPDPQGRFVRQTSTWESDRLMSESAWFLVDSAEAP